MPCRGLIGYYPAFRPAIPVPGVRWRYITHPSATDVLLHPCDLHVLTTPPAFRLSQDQTLQLDFAVHPDPHARRYAGSDSFTGWVVLETSLSFTSRALTGPTGFFRVPAG
jgi:hypothetical protein